MHLGATATSQVIRRNGFLTMAIINFYQDASLGGTGANELIGSSSDSSSSVDRGDTLSFNANTTALDFDGDEILEDSANSNALIGSGTVNGVSVGPGTGVELNYNFLTQGADGYYYRVDVFSFGGDDGNKAYTVSQAWDPVSQSYLDPMKPYNGQELTVLDDNDVDTSDPAIEDFMNIEGSWTLAPHNNDVEGKPANYFADPLDGTILGSSGNDVIDENYFGDPEGDMVDNNDAVSGNVGSNDDIIDAGAGNDSITSGDGNDTIYGGIGGDTVASGDGNDTVYGGDGDELMSGNAGDDSLFGGSGNDMLEGEGGSDVLDGGEGDDRLIGYNANGAFSGSTEVQADDGSPDTFYGGAGNDEVFAGAGNDYIDGGSGVDTAFGGGGDDQLVFDDIDNSNLFAPETVTGGESGETTGDTLDMSTSTEAVDVIFDGNEQGSITETASGEVLNFSEIENFKLGSGDDFVDGTVTTSGINVDGGGGADSMVGGSGGDTLSGGDGDDTIASGDGDDVLYGGDGNDNLSSSFQNDLVFGGAGNDTIDGGVGHDTVFGGDGDDLVQGGGTFGNPNTVYGDAGNDTVYGGGGDADDSLYGGSGNDTLNGQRGDDTIDAGTGDDTISLSDDYGNDTIVGGEDPSGLDVDVLDASGVTADGVDITLTSDEGGTLTSSEGDVSFDEIEDFTLTDQADNFDGSVSNTDHEIDGGSGNDTITGGSGDDVLIGGDGADTLVGGAGVDALFGGAGDDDIALGGTDVATGGSGDDVFTIDDNDPVSGGLPAYVDGGSDGTDGNPGDAANGNEGDLLDLSDQTKDLTVVFDVNPEDGTVDGLDADTADGFDLFFEEIEMVDTGSGNDTIDGMAATEGINVDSGAGNDQVDGGSGDDQISSGTGNDTVSGGAGNDVIDGGDGADTIDGGSGTDTIYGGDGDDTVTIGASDTVFGGSGDDVFYVDPNTGDAGDVTIHGGETGEDLTDATNGGSGDTLDLSALYANGDIEAGSLTMTSAESGSVRLIDGTTINFTEIENFICFTRGTMIRTQHGEKRIEDLMLGDKIVTRDHGLQELRWVGSRELRAVGKIAPIMVKKGAMGNTHDLRVSPQHRMVVGGWKAEMLFGEPEVLVAAKHLVNSDTIYQAEGGIVDYFHILFDRHEIVFANGIPSESFHPGEEGYNALTEDAREEILTLFPELNGDFSTYGPAARTSLKEYEAKVLCENPKFLTTEFN